ncbi:MAG: glutamyl-tRNA reductase [candidate division Zixibacteria bacterium]|nr:glutamyl-tRNA reductase [candidate division Zixibacteria bacterium]
MTSSSWHLIVCGISHKTSTLKQREPLQIGRDEIVKAAISFGELKGVMEVIIVSTCNRVEFYAIAKKIAEPFELVKSFYQNYKNLDIADIEHCFYSKNNKHTVSHLFNVAAGIDSMVLGENQILGQLKDAYSSACTAKTTGKIIHKLFHQAFRVGKLVRSETEMGKGACSVSSTTVEFLKDRISRLGKPAILFVGVNQIINLAASKIIKFPHGKLMFANRTPEKAVKFAAKFNGSGYSLDRLSSLIESADLVITCTGSKEPVITRQMIDTYISSGKSNGLIIMDIAAPRDVEIGKNYHANIEVFDLEDIKQHVKEHQQKRELAIPQAQEIIERKLSEFAYWFDQVRHEPSYNGLGEACEEIRLKEISKVLGKLSPELKDEVNRTTKVLVKKILQVKFHNRELV